MRITIAVLLTLSCLTTTVWAQGGLIILPEKGLFGGGYRNEIKLVKLPASLPQPELVAVYQNSWSIHQLFGGPEPSELALKLEYGRMNIRPEVGLVSLVVRLEGEYDTVVAEVNALPATIFIGNFNNRYDTLPLRMLKHQGGLRAEVENFNINMRCPVRSFEMTIAGEEGKRDFQVIGGRFNEDISKELQLVQRGDLIIFRKIYYQCPGAEEFQRAKNIVFEIK